MDYEAYGWKYGSNIAYWDDGDFVLEADGWWEIYEDEISLLEAMTKIAPIHLWRFCKTENLKENHGTDS